MARPNQDLEKSGNPENTRNQGYAENPQYIQNPGEGLDGSKIIHPDQLGRRAGLGLRGELMLRVDLENEDELITPTIEHLSILEEKVIINFFSCLKLFFYLYLATLFKTTNFASSNSQS